MRYVTKTVELTTGSYKQRLTDHSVEIARMREVADTHGQAGRPRSEVLAMLVACDLLEGHDATGLSLDNWALGREFVESIFRFVILENGV